MSFTGLTGDMHGEPYDLKRLSTKNFPISKDFTKDDVIVILGDFQFPYSNTVNAEEEYWLDWLNAKKFTTVFVDGNHDNFDRLMAYDTEERFGSPVGIVRDSIYHLRRGNIYDINNNSIFVMGGGKSIDRASRLKQEDGFKLCYGSLGTPIWIDTGVKKPRSRWWPEEIPNAEEWDNAWKNIAAHDFKVDYVLTHAPPYNLVEYYRGLSHHGPSDMDPVSIQLQGIADVLQFKYWYHGHMHLDTQVHAKYICLYNKIIELGDSFVKEWYDRFEE